MSDRVIEVLVLAVERGGAIVRTILEELAVAIGADVKLLEALDTEVLESRINAGAVVALPWFVLLVLNLSHGPFRAFYRTPAGLVVVLAGGLLTLVGSAWIARLGRFPDRTACVRREQSVIATSSSALPAALCVAVAAGAFAHAIVPSRPRAAARIRPYIAAARASLGHAPDSGGAGGASVGDARGVAAVLALPVRALAQRLGAIVESRTDDAIELRLFQAGRRDVSVTEHRVAQVARGARFALVLGAAGVVFVHTPLFVLALAVAGFVAGAARVRGDLDRAIARRTERMELELATVNQLLAMHVRSGSGAVQSVQRLVDRGQGVLVEELDATLARIRSGVREPEAFRRAAELTPCRDAARTYQLIATSVERGTDLAVALLAIGDDLRDTRREALRKSAVRRRAGMLAPTIGILAPIMLLFVAAPLPSIVLGNR